MTYFNQSGRRLRKKHDLEKLLNPKSPVDSQKNKWKTDTTKCSIEYKVSKALITDLDTKHWTYKPTGGPPSNHKMKENSNKKT